MPRFSFSGLALVAAALAACSSATQPPLGTYTAALTGANEVPPNPSTATASATFVRDNDSTVSYSITASNLANPLAAHIHAGGAGVNGPVVVNLCGTTSTPACAAGTVTGLLTQGRFLRSQVTVISYDSVLVLMGNGNAYANVHTQAKPGGEIRSQIARQ